MKNKRILIIVSILIAAVLLASCGQAPTEDANTSAQSANPSQTPTDHASTPESANPSGSGAADQNAVYGNVTAISGDTITIAVGTLNQQARPSGSAPAQQGTDGQNNGTPPSGNPSGMPSGGERPSMLTLTGETKNITVSDPSVISKQSFGSGPNSQQSGSSAQPSIATQQASLTDIQVGSTLKITYASDNTTIQSIEIMGGFNRGNQGGPNGGGNASATPSDS